MLCAAAGSAEPQLLQWPLCIAQICKLRERRRKVRVKRGLARRVALDHWLALCASCERVVARQADDGRHAVGLVVPRLLEQSVKVRNIKLCGIAKALRAKRVRTREAH